MNIEYPISKDYVKDWGIWEATREILQNAMDSGSWSHIFEDGMIVILNDGTVDRNDLILGHTSKNDSDRGKYGEGLKLAMLVLARLDRNFILHTGTERWIASIVNSEQFNAEVLSVRITPLDTTQVEIFFSLTQEEYDDIFNNKICNDPYGIIGEGGKIFVGGLYIANLENLKYSYNLPPEYVTLNRDRNIPRLFDIQYHAGEYMSGEDILDIIESGHDDISSLNANARKMAEAWDIKYGNTVPIGISEQDTIKAEHSRIVPDWLAKAIRSVKNFLFDTTKSPVERLEKWYGHNKWQLNSEAKVELESILKDIEEED